MSKGFMHAYKECDDADTGCWLVNIFVLDLNPVLAAQQQCDKHVVKMIVESAQMLSTAHRLLDGDLIVDQSTGRGEKKWQLPDGRDSLLYQAVHMHHPCACWTMASNANYVWHWRHFIALCDEYTFRYGRVHSTDTRLRDALAVLPANIPYGPLTPFALAMKANPECMSKDPVRSYQLFYSTKQSRFKMVWTKRETPTWFKVLS